MDGILPEARKYYIAAARLVEDELQAEVIALYSYSNVAKALIGWETGNICATQKEAREIINSWIENYEKST